MQNTVYWFLILLPLFKVLPQPDVKEAIFLFQVFRELFGIKKSQRKDHQLVFLIVLSLGSLIIIFITYSIAYELSKVNYSRQYNHLKKIIHKLSTMDFFESI